MFAVAPESRLAIWWLVRAASVPGGWV